MSDSLLRKAIVKGSIGREERRLSERQIQQKEKNLSDAIDVAYFTFASDLTKPEITVLVASIVEDCYPMDYVFKGLPVKLSFPDMERNYETCLNFVQEPDMFLAYLRKLHIDTFLNQKYGIGFPDDAMDIGAWVVHDLSDAYKQGSAWLELLLAFLLLLHDMRQPANVFAKKYEFDFLL